MPERLTCHFAGYRAAGGTWATSRRSRTRVTVTTADWTAEVVTFRPRGFKAHKFTSTMLNGRCEGRPLALQRMPTGASRLENGRDAAPRPGRACATPAEPTERGKFACHYEALVVLACGEVVGRLLDFDPLLRRRHCWACSSSSVALGSPNEAASTLMIDGTSHVQGYDWTVASAACRAAPGWAQSMPIQLAVRGSQSLAQRRQRPDSRHMRWWHESSRVTRREPKASCAITA